MGLIWIIISRVPGLINKNGSHNGSFKTPGSI